jgi:hypothetical protein
MPRTFKVIETFRLHDGADLSDLQSAICIMAGEPFSLSQLGVQRGLVFVDLVRDGDEQTDESEPEASAPQKDKTTDEGQRSQSSSWHDSQWQDRQWKDSDWQEEHWQTTDWQEKQWQTTDSQTTDWQTTDWEDTEWQGGNPCHVCGKTRAEHPGKKFCNVYSNKRARV